MHLPSVALNNPMASQLESVSKAGDSAIHAEGMQAASRDFESVFLSMLLKEMRNSLDQDGEGGLFAGEKSDTLGSLFDMYLGQHLAAANSLGIAQAMQSYLTVQSSSSDRVIDPNRSPNPSSHGDNQPNSDSPQTGIG